MLDVVVILDECVDGEKLFEGVLGDLEFPIDVPSLGFGQQFELMICAKYKGTLLLHFDISPEELIW